MLPKVHATGSMKTKGALMSARAGQEDLKVNSPPGILRKILFAADLEDKDVTTPVPVATADSKEQAVNVLSRSPNPSPGRGLLRSLSRNNAANNQRTLAFGLTRAASSNKLNPNVVNAMRGEMRERRDATPFAISVVPS